MNDYIFVTFKLLGSLALLMFGMKLMSETLQKMAGPQLRHVLGAMTTNRFTGMLTGILVTAAVQETLDEGVPATDILATMIDAMDQVGVKFKNN